jgi:hypothetical protein
LDDLLGASRLPLPAKDSGFQSRHASIDVERNLVAARVVSLELLVRHCHALGYGLYFVPQPFGFDPHFVQPAGDGPYFVAQFFGFDPHLVQPAGDGLYFVTQPFGFDPHFVQPTGDGLYFVA